MKASESVKNYASSVRMYANYTTREIRKICKEIGPRPSGSESEKKAQEYIADQMKTCADEVTIESFKLAPKAFMSWIKVDGILLIICAILGLLKVPYAHIISLVLTIFAFIFCACEFLVYGEFIDPIFPKKTSHNAIAVKKATGELKQRIIFSGHVDSSFEWTYTHLGGAPLLFTAGIFAVVTLLFMLVKSILITTGVAADGTTLYNILYWAQIICIPGGIVAFFFVNSTLCVEGANDNLTGAISSVAILKYLKDNDIDFEHTEVIAVAAGSEEAGLRGSRAYTKRHKEEFSDVPTIFVGLETFREYEHISIYERDMTGTVKMDKGVCTLLKKAGLEAGRDLPYASIYMGASDAAAVQKLGVPAATMAAMNPTVPRYYHTRRDTGDNLDLKAVEKCLEISLNALFIYDEEGYKKDYLTE